MMKLSRLLFGRSDASTAAERPPLEEAVVPATGAPHGRPRDAVGELDDNVIALHPNANSSDRFAQSETSRPSPLVANTAHARPYHGSLDDPAIAEFFAHNYWAFGRIQGARAHSQVALDMELDVLTSNFQNVLHAIVAKRQCKLDKTRHYKLEVPNGEATLPAQLDLAVQHQQREISELEEQIELAMQRKGWVMQALNRFRLGFQQGVREHLEFQQIFG